MSVISKQFLSTIGIELDDQTYQAFVEHFDETLSERIIDEIIDSLSDEQVEQLAQAQNAGGDQLWQWLQAAVPDLSEIIQQEIDILLGDLAEDSDHF